MLCAAFFVFTYCTTAGLARNRFISGSFSAESLKMPGYVLCKMIWVAAAEQRRRHKQDALDALRSKVRSQSHFKVSWLKCNTPVLDDVIYQRHRSIGSPPHQMDSYYDVRAENLGDHILGRVSGKASNLFDECPILHVWLKPGWADE